MEELAAVHARRILSLDSAALAQVFSDEPSATRFSAVMTLRWGSYGPFTQVRKTFPDIPELAEDIARRGILNPQTVFAFPRAVAERYVAALNLMWGVTDDLSALPECLLHNEPVFYVLIAGERRFRALRHLWNHGCSMCLASFGAESVGACFLRHFPHGLIPVTVKVGFTPYDALTDQFAENTHHRPRPEEEAIGFRVFFELMRVRETHLTVAEFARRIGHNEGKVRAALRYTHLPEFVQAAVAEGKIPYTSAIALERYHRERKNDEDLQYWLTRAIAESEVSSRRLFELLREDLRQWKASQLGLFGALLLNMQERKIRQVFDRNIARALDRINGLLYAAVQAEQTGNIGAEDSPFAQGSVARAIVRIYRLLGLVVPIVRSSMTRQERTEAERICQTLAEDIEWIEERVDEKGTTR